MIAQRQLARPAEPSKDPVPPAPKTLRQAQEQFVREYIIKALERCGWDIRCAAKMLGMQRTNLYRRIRVLKILRGQQRFPSEKGFEATPPYDLTAD